MFEGTDRRQLNDMVYGFYSQINSMHKFTCQVWVKFGDRAGTEVSGVKVTFTDVHQHPGAFQFVGSLYNLTKHDTGTKYTSD